MLVLEFVQAAAQCKIDQVDLFHNGFGWVVFANGEFDGNGNDPVFDYAVKGSSLVASPTLEPIVFLDLKEAYRFVRNLGYAETVRLDTLGEAW